MTSIQVILGFDMETDIGSWTPFCEGLIHGTPRLLEVLARHEAKSSFFFVADVARRYTDVVKMVDETNHEIGCHTLYHETIGDELFPIPGIKPLLPEEVYHRIEVATDIIEQIAGKKVVSFRSPRLWGSTTVVNALEELGYEADASYPMYFYKDRLTPYHPSRTDWTSEGDMQILEIPNFADMTIDSKDEYGRDRDQWPLFRTQGAEKMMEHVSNMLGLYQSQGQNAVFCFYLHPWEFHQMPEGAIYFGEGGVVPDPFLVKNCGDLALQQLDILLSMLKDMGAEFVTAGELAGAYKPGQ